LDNFELTPIFNPNEELPNSFLLRVINLDLKLNFTKIDGKMNNPAENNDVYFMNGQNIQKAASSNFVKKNYF
jgi:hypothetical protein